MLPDFITHPDPGRYFTDNYVVLDFETDTSHGDFGHPVFEDNQLLLACWTLGPGHPAFEEEGKVYSVWGNEYMMQSLVDHLNAALLLVAHNAKYELGWLTRCGFDTGSVLVFCTKVAEYVLTGNLPHPTSLDACCRKRGLPVKDPVVDHMMGRGVNPVEIPRAWLQGRCIQDVQTTEMLFKDQLDTLDRSGRLGVQYTRCIFTPVLADMETKGMKLDADRVREEHARETENYEQAKVALQRFANINWNSDKQLGEFLYESLEFEELRNKKGEPIRTAGGAYKTDLNTLNALKAKTPEQKRFLKVFQEYNASGSRLSK